VDVNQLISLLSGAAQPAIFAGLFIWLFSKDRDESRARETWFRDATDKLRLALEANNEQQRQQTQIMAQMLSQLNRIEGQRGGGRREP